MSAVNQKAEAPDFTRPADLETAVRRVADQLHRLNLAIAGAVDAGATIELVRGSRYHGGDGRWGDQMVPVVILAEGQGWSSRSKD